MRATRTNEQTGEVSTVGDIAATRKYLVFHPDQFIKIILATMQRAQIGCAAVVDDKGRLFGMLTEREILRRIFAMVADPTISHANLGKHIEDMRVYDVMIPDPVTLGKDTDIEDALARMTTLGFRFMPVVDEQTKKLIGLVDEREVAVHVKNRLDRVKREAAEKEAMLHHLFREPYGIGYGLQTQ